jgi:glutathione S-transferase
MANTFKAVLALGPSLARLARGAVAIGNRGVPTKTLELYDCENNQDCRPVREALTVLDLDVMVYPVPRNGERFREQLADMGGADGVPFLHDPNTGERLQGAASIVDYLYSQFAPEGSKAPRNLIPLACVAGALRRSRGRLARPSRAAEQPLELYSFEASPYSRLVRESLCELEIPYLLHNVGKSPGKMVEYLPPIMRENKVKGYEPETENRRKLVERGGHMMVPYLVDPNTNTEMFESAAIVDYLDRTYARSA